MITRISGKLIEKQPTHVIIEANGIGYFINVSIHTSSKILDEIQLKLYTHLQIREDAHTLYGFISILERELFRLLISVNGIGANTARTMLSSLSPVQIKEAIAGEQVSVIQSVKGIGVKTAQRVIIDLKDKIIKLYGLDDTVSSSENNTNQLEALSALEVLGFNKKQSEKVVKQILTQHTDASIEFIIKEALKNL